MGKFMPENKKRFFVLDLIRGLAVFLMIAAHAIYFFHNSTNETLLFLEKVGNTFCFTAFLLVSGAVAYIAYINHEEERQKFQKKLLKRILIILASYFSLALLVSFSQIIQAKGFEKWNIIFDILIFKNVPSYTEFIPPFIIYSLVILIFPKLIKGISRSPFVAAFVSIYLYFTGFLLYKLSVPEFFEPWKAFFAGHENYYRFPVLQYAPIFILGLTWGQLLKKTQTLKEKKEIAKFLAIVSSIGILIAVLAAHFHFKSFDILFLRWPPSITFLLIGITSTFLISFLFYSFKILRKLHITNDLLLIFGQNAFAFFWVHIFLLSSYQMLGGAKVGSVLIFFILFLMLIGVSVILAAIIPFNFKFNLTIHKLSKEEEDQALEKEPVYHLEEDIYKETKNLWKKIKDFFFPKHDGTAKKEKQIKKRHFLGAILAITILSFTTLLSLAEENQKNIITQQKTPWWNDEYSYHMPLEIKNLESFSSIPKNKILKITIDHQSLVNQKKSQPNGNDIRFIYWNNNSYEEIDYWIDNTWDLNNTTLKIKIPEKISSGETKNNISLYYGNLAAENKVKDSPTENLWSYKYEIKAGKEETYPIIVKTNKTWNLISDIKNISSNLDISVESSSIPNNASAEFKISESFVKGKMELNPENNLWEGSIPIKKLSPGVHQVQVTFKNNDQILKSQKQGFYVSYPIYVTWNQDWEGYDVQSSYIQAMESISKKHGMPMTHLFNPRIYVTSTIPQNRQDFLTNWVKERKEKYGEEIGLHLHMFYDFIADSGVEVKHSSNWPNWGDIYGDGYSVLTTNYSQEEMIKIIERSFWWFNKKGLGQPISFRAGGWFANLETLKALEKAGIKIDTSGRTAYDFGYNGYEKQKGYWNLSQTAQPYKPSLSDQNISGRNNLKIWEVPNNGADSFWFKETEMISRFKQNYSGGIQKERKQITFLSHPHWLNKQEQERIEKVFNYTDQYKYDKDSGPVIYVTLENIYEDWLKNEE